MKKLLLGFVVSLTLLGFYFIQNNPENGSEKTTFRMALNSEPPTLDWSLATDNVSIRVIENLMDGLVAFDQDLQTQPAIATDWQVSEDGLVYTFHLRTDVTWSDGVPLEAAHFEYAWKRLLDPKTASEYAYFLYDLKNAFEYNSGTVTDPEEVGVKALDQHTLQVGLKKKAVYFPAMTTFVGTYPQREDLIKQYGSRWTDPKNLVTLGPFRLTEWQHEYRLTLSANASYYEGRPALDEVIFYVVEEQTTALTLYETGDLDRVPLPPIAIPSYKDHPDYHHVPFLRGYYYGFNHQAAPFNDLRVRRAFSMAIDRTELPKILKGGEIAAGSWIPEGMFAHNANIGLAFNPKEARRLLAEAGFSNPRQLPTITLSFNTDPTNRLIAQNIQAQWKKNLGIEIQLDNLEWKVYLKQLQTETPQIFRLGWGADYPDPDNFMNLFTGSSGNNYTGWANAEYDQLISEAASEIDPQKRLVQYNRAQRILTEEDAAIMPLFFASQNLLVNPRFEGTMLNAMDILSLKSLRLRAKQVHPQEGSGT